MVEEGYVTYKELSDSQERCKVDIMEHVERGNKEIEKLDIKVNKQIEQLDIKVIGINEKVGHLNDLVLPLTVAMKQTAENTKEISESLKDFTKNQSVTNSIFNDKIHSHDLTIEGIKAITNGITEKKKYNVTVLVAIIGLVGTSVAAFFQFAPVLFNG